MRIITRPTLTNFYQIHPQAKPALVHWMQVAKAATWRSPAEVQAAFSNAKVLNHERVRFEIQGGNYRLIVAFDFRREAAFVKFIGTHEEYDRINALTVNLY